MTIILIMVTILAILSSYLLAGGWAWLTQLRFTYEPSLMSPGGLTTTRVDFGESKQRNGEKNSNSEQQQSL